MKLKTLILEQDIDNVEDLFTTQRSPEERSQNRKAADLKRVKQYIKDGFSGDLDLEGTELKELPAELTQVGGDLDLFNSKVEKLPNLTKVIGDLEIHGTNIKEIPNSLKYVNTIIAYESKLKKLPDNLIVRTLDISQTNFEILPKNLTVGESLLAFNTEIKEIPDSIVFEEGIDIYLTSSRIQKLPNDLYIDGSLFLNNTPIQTLPDNLHVEYDLWVNYTRLDDIPKGLVVNGKLNIRNTPIYEKQNRDADKICDLINSRGGSIRCNDIFV